MRFVGLGVIFGLGIANVAPTYSEKNNVTCMQYCTIISGSLTYNAISVSTRSYNQAKK